MKNRGTSRNHKEEDNFKLLLDRLAHSLRTPLTSVKAAASLLRNAEAQLDEEARHELVTIIDDEADRLNRIIDKLLLIACIEFNEVRLKQQPQRIEDIISVARERLYDTLKDYQIDLHLPPNLPMVEVDFELISKVFVYLLDNASKYSSVDTPITIAVEHKADKLHVTISDNGVGIKSKDLENIFDKLYQPEIEELEEIARRGRRRGTGMSLAISRGVLAAHQGKIWAESKRGHNTTIHIELPVMTNG